MAHQDRAAPLEKLRWAWQRVLNALPDHISLSEIDKRRDSSVIYGSVSTGASVLGCSARVGRVPGGTREHFEVSGSPELAGPLRGVLNADLELGRWLVSPSVVGRLHWRIEESEFLARLAGGDPLGALELEPRVALTVALRHALVGNSPESRDAFLAGIDSAQGDACRLSCLSIAAGAAGFTDIALTARASELPLDDPTAEAVRILELALAAARNGETEVSRRHAAAIRAEHLQSRDRFLDLLFELGEFDLLRTWIDPKHDVQVVARLALAEGRYEDALSVAEVGDDTVNQAGALLGLGRTEEAIERLRYAPEGVLRDLLLAEANLRKGKYWRALRAAAETERMGDNFAAHAVRMAATSRVPVPDFMWRLWVRRDASFDPLRGGAFEPFGDARGALRSRSKARALFDSTLSQLRGTRAEPLTRVGPSGALERIRPGLSTRQRAVAILRRFAKGDAPGLIDDAFRELQEEFASSPFPWTYFGEYLLWTGRTAEARRAFLEALRRARTRWVFVGLSICELMDGNPRRAKAISRLGVLYCGSVPESTAPGVSGEAELELGNYGAAQRQLSLACSTRSGRVGARVSLALTHLALGDVQGAEEAWGLVSRARPALARAAERPTLRETLLEFRRSLLGNRSSWFRSGELNGEFRIFANSDDLIEAAKYIRKLADRRAAKPSNSS